MKYLLKMLLKSSGNIIVYLLLKFTKNNFQ